MYEDLITPTQEPNPIATELEEARVPVYILAEILNVLPNTLRGWLSGRLVPEKKLYVALEEIGRDLFPRAPYALPRIVKDYLSEKGLPTEQEPEPECCLRCQIGHEAPQTMPRRGPKPGQR